MAFLIIAILTGVRWYLFVVWFAFPCLLVMLSIFSCAFCPSVCCLWKNVYSCPLSNQIFFLNVDLYEFFVFWILTPYWIYHLQISFPIQEAAFSFYWWCPSLCKNFLVWFHLICLFLLLLPLCKETVPKKILLRPMSQSTLPVFSSGSFFVSRSYILNL